MSGSEHATGTVTPLSDVDTPATHLILLVFLIVFIGERIVAARFGTGATLLLAVQSDHLPRVWTWITAMLVHVNPVHLFANSLFLYLFGRGVERRYGTRAFVTVFLVTGVLTAVFGTALAGLNECGTAAFGTDGPCHAVGGGSSMALFGLVGFLTRHRPAMPMTILPSVRVPLWAFTGGFVAVSVLGMYTPVDPLSALVGFPVGHAYHFVGVLVGLALGSVWRPAR